MNPDWINVFAAACSALAAFFAWWIALVSLRDSRVLAEEARRRDAQALEASLQARLDPLYPGLRAVLGSTDDGVPLEIRSVLIPFFVLYADAFAAHRDGILSDAEWGGLGVEFVHWAQRPVARRAWEAFRRQEWTDGFGAHVDDVLSGPAAYRGMEGLPFSPPSIPWPEQPPEPTTPAPSTVEAGTATTTGTTNSAAEPPAHRPASSIRPATEPASASATQQADTAAVD